MTDFRETTPPHTEQQPPPPASEWDFLNGSGVPPGARGQLPDLAQLFAVLDSLRRVVPQELQQQFNALVRELLLTVRAVIDWYLERLEQGPREPEIEDIPIE